MSNPQYSPYGTCGPYETYEPYGPSDEASEASEPYGQTDEASEPYGRLHADTYRPAYESPVPQAPEENALPRRADGRAPTGGRAQARRATRRRKTGARPEPFRRLLPQALVVAFLAGGTSAFVAKDKAIELSVDGRPRTLHTLSLIHI